MSHTTKIEGVMFKDVRAMEKAVADLQARGVNCSLVENQRPRMYYADQHKRPGQEFGHDANGTCAYVLKLPDAAYDVGFDRQDDGTFRPVTDEYSYGVTPVSDVIGGACPVPTTKEEKAMWAIGQFSQNYSKHAAIHAAEAEGYMVTGTSTDADGNVHVEVQV